MKRGWAALILILVCVGLSVAEWQYLDGSIHACVQMLEEAEAHMERNEFAEAESLAQRIDRRFASNEGILDILMYHSEVLEVSKGLAELCRYAQAGSTAEFLAVSGRIRRSLLSMHSTRIPRIGNVL